jgi:single-stranded DNA-binding protein
VYVEGRATQRSYDVEREGVKFQNYVYETHATKVEFLDRAPQQGTQDTPAARVAPQEPVEAVYAPDGDVPW